MAASSGSTPKSITGLHTSLEASEPTDGENLLRQQSASPEPYEGAVDYFDFEKAQGAPQRRSTHPPVPNGSPDEPKRGNLGRARTAVASHTKRGTNPPVALNRTKSSESHPSGQSPSRHSTVDTKNSASFEETEVWDRKAILSLDGGGIRGYSALLILQELMKAIGRLETSFAAKSAESDGPAESSYHPLRPASVTATDAGSIHSQAGNEPHGTESSPWLPCHYFDYMAGTSTGGLISIMLGRLRMNIDDCISDYEEFGARVFGYTRWFHLRSPLFWIRDKYNHKVLEDVMRDVVRRRVPKVAEFPGGRNFAFDENRCRTLVIAFQKQRLAGVEQPYLFRSYKNLHRNEDPKKRKLDRNPALAHDIPIWQVARATSAAPTYFKPAVIDGLEYLDGGFGANNPCTEIYQEVRKMNNNYEKSTSIIVSVGTGKNNKASRFSGTGLSRYWNYLNFARKWASDSEKTHDDMIQKVDSCTDKPEYFRLNVEEGLDKMKLDDWQSRSSLRISVGRCIGKLRTGRRIRQTDGSIKTSNTGTVHLQQGQQSRDNLGHRQNGLDPITEKDDAGGDDASQDAPKEQNGELQEQPGMVSIGRDNANSSLVHIEDASKAQANVQTNHQDGNMQSKEASAYRQSEDHLADDISPRIPKWLRPRNKTLETIRTHTETYLSRKDVKEEIEQCAQLLVLSRRGRAKRDPQRWEKACYGAWYQCNVPKCPRGEKEYQEYHDLEKHLLHKHRDKFSGTDGQQKLETMLMKCKIVVQ